MKEIKKRELELLTDICKQHNVSVKLANQLLKSAEKFSYENSTTTARTKEYQDLIDFHTKNK